VVLVMAVSAGHHPAFEILSFLLSFLLPLARKFAIKFRFGYLNQFRHEGLKLSEGGIGGRLLGRLHPPPFYAKNEHCEIL